MPATVWKAIKASRLRDDQMRLALLNSMRKVGREIQADFKKTTATWDHKPEFEMLISLTQPGPTVVVGTNDEIYGYVSEGTKPHIILPRRAKALRFQGMYTAKTTPGVIDSRSGGASGDVVFTKGVMHPGTEARKFDETIAKAWQPKFKKAMEKTMREVRKVSGHAL